MSMNEIQIAVVAILAVVALFAIFASVARMYRKVGPNQALIIYGVGGTRVVIGSGALVLPMVQTSRELSLELMSFDVAPTKELYTGQGVAVKLEAVTQLKVKSDLQSVRTAAEQFLDKRDVQREAAIRLVMEGHLRGIVGQLTVEQIVKDPEMVGDKVRSTCAADLAKMGLEMVSFTIKEVRDENDYIAHMGRPDIERVKMEANIAAAEAQRDTDIKRAQAARDAAMAQAKADEERVAAQAASAAQQAEAQRDLEVKKAQYLEMTQRQKAVADKAYEIQAAVMQQQAIAEKVKIEQIERAAQVLVQETEIRRAQNELTATKLTDAQIEAKRMLALAEAEKARALMQAEADKQRVLLEAEAEAEATRKKGEAEAEVIRLKGEAEAAAMDQRAKAYRGYNEAAVLDKLLGSLPQVVAAVAQPLANVDKITIVSTGDGDGGSGASRITGDVAKIVAQVPQIVESLSGVSLTELVKSVPRLATSAATSTPKPSAPPPRPSAPMNGR